MKKAKLNEKLVGLKNVRLFPVKFKKLIDNFLKQTIFFVVKYKSSVNFALHILVKYEKENI